MNDVEKTKESLKTILKKGDIYDTIAIREGVKLKDHTFLRMHILLLSRILYGGVLIYDKIKSYFSPIKEVRRAQNQIRKSLGVRIDVVRSKSIFNFFSNALENTLEEELETLKPTLSILYENENVSSEEYINHLRKISTFCELYQIDDILLSESDIRGLFPSLASELLEEFPITSMKKVLNYNYVQHSTYENFYEDSRYPDNYDIEERISSTLFKLTLSDLRKLIQKLEYVKINKKTIHELGSKIGDIPIQNAIEKYFETGNLEQLRRMVCDRLTLYLNSDSSYLDKHFGKTFQSINVKDEYIVIVSTNQKGKVINNTVTTLYDYAGVFNYSDLLKLIKKESDNHELYAMMCLHLYLCQKTKVKDTSRSKSVSLYDYIYHSFRAKQKGRIKKIPGLYSKQDRKLNNIAAFYTNFILTALLAMTICFSGMAANFLVNLSFQNDNLDIFHNLKNTVLLPYIKSYQFEYQIFKDVLQEVRDITLDFTEFMEAFTGDVSDEVVNNNQTVAFVNPLSDDIPTYFAISSADSTDYEKGQLTYSCSQPVISGNDFEEVETLFEVQYTISNSLLRSFIYNEELQIPGFFYPVGDNYVLTSMEIRDLDDSSKAFQINAGRVSGFGMKITQTESSLLQSMSNPQFVCSYGVGVENQNSFLDSLGKDVSYFSSSHDDIKNAILSGLQLEEFATDREIFLAISSKDYSTAPFEDAKLTGAIRTLDEKEYLETTASLSSLNCNLAATLAVGTSEELIYVVGYHNTDDNYISANEAHAWAMNEKGDIIDLTPSTRAEKARISFIYKVLRWGIDNHIPLYLVLACVFYKINKRLGKKVKVYIRIQKVKKTLTSPDIESSYATLKDILYGGINMPCNRTPDELLEVIEKELSGFSTQELKAIKKELEKSEYNRNGELTTSLQVIKNVSFMKENSTEIQKALKKTKKH